MCTALYDSVHCITESCANGSVMRNRWRSTVRRRAGWQITGRRRRRATRPPPLLHRPRR